MKKRIAYIVSTLRRTGPTHQLLYIIRYLDRNDFEPLVITLSPEPDDSMMETFLEEEIPVYTLGLGRLKGLLYGRINLESMVRDLAPDLVHTQGLRPDLMGLGIGGRPLVSTQRNDPFVDYPAKYGKLKGGLMAWQQLRAIHKGKNVYACSSSLAEAYKEKYRLHIPFVQNGVDTEALLPVDSGEKRRLREELALRQDQLIILAVGSLISRKDNSVIVRAVNALEQPATLVLLGKGPDAARLRELQPDPHRLLMPGQVDNVKDYLGAADMFVSASLSEGLPNTLLEALACGLPPALSDIPPHREAMEGTDWHAFFPVGGGEIQLKVALEKLFMKPKDGWTDVLRAQAMKFSARRMSETYQEIYRKLLR